MIRFALNVLWLIFGGGLVLFLGYALAAVICFVLIVTLPFAFASWRLAVYSLWPFGRTVRAKEGGTGVATDLANIVWVIVAGWWLALTHIATGILLCITIIGIPLGLANFKLIEVSLMPLGKQIVRKPRPVQIPVERPTTGAPSQMP